MQWTVERAIIILLTKEEKGFFFLQYQKNPFFATSMQAVLYFYFPIRFWLQLYGYFSVAEFLLPAQTRLAILNCTWR
jgi:hypothetical protein